MPIKVTRLQDVYKNQVKDSFKMPTIWLDSITGEEHEDYEHTYIESKDPDRPTWAAPLDVNSYVDKPTTSAHEILFINGYIKQIGSHVIYCGKLADRAVNGYPCLDNLLDVFKYAYNLERVAGALSGETYIKDDYAIPEDLFWNCPNLKEVTRFFESTRIKKVPSGLFSKCTNLESVQDIFYNTQITKIPADLFKNNPKIKNFESAFNCSDVTEIPDNLFSAVREHLINGDVNVSGFVYSTPLSDKFFKEEAPKTKEERDAKRNKYLPSDLPREVQWRLINDVRIFPDEKF